MYFMCDNNMIFMFGSAVILVISSVCASASLDSLPDLEDGLSWEAFKSSIPYEDYIRLAQDAADYVDKYGPPQQEGELRRLLRVEKELEKRLILYYDEFNREQQYENRRFQKLPESNDRRYDHYQLKYPNQQILDDVRPYPHEGSSDFSFKETMDESVDDGDSVTHDENVADDNDYEELREYNPVVKTSPAEASGTNELHISRNTPAVDTKRPVVKDRKKTKTTLIDSTNDQFAYAPPDPRFYEEDENRENLDVISPISQPKLLAHPPVITNPPGPGVDYASMNSDAKSTPLEVQTRNNEYNSRQNYGGGRPDYIGRQHLLLSPPNRQYNDGSMHVVPVSVHPFSGSDSPGVYIIAIVAGISAAATVGLIAFGIGWYNLQKHVKNATDVEYPAYGVTGPNKEVSPSGDRRLAQSAQMYHYQHQKQQIIAMESRVAAGERHGSVSEADSDEENEEGDYTVYECPGLAPTGEMEVKNPMFQDEPTPAQTPQLKSSDPPVAKKN